MNFRRTVAAFGAIAALTGATYLYLAHPASSSDHQDTVALASNPRSDITDVYVFPSPTNANAIDLVMNVYPLIPAGMSGSAFFDPNVLYQFKLVHGAVGTMSAEDQVFQIHATGDGPTQTLTLYGGKPSLTGPYSLVGPKIGSFPFNVANGTTLQNGTVAFAGPRADPFFFDLFQFFTILPDRNVSNPRTGDMLGSSTPSFNGYSASSTAGPGAGNYACSSAASTNALTQINGGFNVLSIVLEIPKNKLVRGGQSSIVHVWATTSTPNGNRINKQAVFKQNELLSRPAVKELFEVFNQHHLTNAVSPYNDRFIQGAIAHFMSHVAGRSSSISSVVSAVLYPNEMAADLSQNGPAAYLGVETGGATGSKFGGRGLTDNVIDTSLGVVFGNTIPALGLAQDDGKENNCLTSQHVSSGQGGQQTQATYPYLAPPH